MTDGSELLDWIHFYPSNSSIGVYPPAGYNKRISVDLIAEDNNGNKGKASFSIIINQCREYYD